MSKIIALAWIVAMICAAIMIVWPPFGDILLAICALITAAAVIITPFFILFSKDTDW